jgi:hypothetical protein
MRFPSKHSRQQTIHRAIREKFTQHQQQEKERDHRHDDNIMTDTHANLEPAAVVADEEEEMLKHMKHTILN